MQSRVAKQAFQVEPKVYKKDLEKALDNTFYGMLQSRVAKQAFQDLHMCKSLMIKTPCFLVAIPRSKAGISSELVFVMNYRTFKSIDYQGCNPA